MPQLRPRGLPRRRRSGRRRPPAVRQPAFPPARTGPCAGATSTGRSDRPAMPPGRHRQARNDPAEGRSSASAVLGCSRPGRLGPRRGCARRRRRTCRSCVARRSTRVCSHLAPGTANATGKHRPPTGTPDRFRVSPADPPTFGSRNRHTGTGGPCDQCARHRRDASCFDRLGNRSPPPTRAALMRHRPARCSPRHLPPIGSRWCALMPRAAGYAA